MDAKRFRAAMVALALAYFLIESVYVVRLPLVTDEFDGAYEAYRLRHSVPYRDYVPYKTVLGYSIEAVPSFLGGDVWSRILAIKLTLVAINAAMLLWAASSLQRIAGWRGVVFALALLVANSNFLERSAELRVDMLTGWAGLASLIFLLENRFAAAGVACALSFLISQKGAFYAVAACAAIGVAWVIERRVVTRSIARFGGAFVLVIGAYVAVWSVVASPAAVLRATFQSAAGQAMLTFYDIRHVYWPQVAIRNPLWVVLPLIAAGILLRRREHTFIVVYALALFAEAVAFPQPWPYFFPLIWPTFFVLFAFFFDAVALPRWATATIALAGIAWPLLRLPAVLQRDNRYQRYNVAIASAMLERHETYIAGTDIVHDHEQTIQRLERLDARMLTLLSREPTPVVENIVRDIDQHPPKLLMATYRLYGMPKALLAYFDAHYVRLTASIHGYAPLIQPGASMQRIAFAGRYRVDSPQPQAVRIDGHIAHTGDAVMLQAGSHGVDAPSMLRLRLIPEKVEAQLDPEFVDEQPFYVNPYTY